MESLSAVRLTKVLQATAQAVEFRELDEFRSGVISLVRELVPCESVSYNEIRPGVNPIVIADPNESLTEESIETFGRFAHENPLVAYFAATLDGRPLRFSDFISRCELHQLTLYDQLYRQLGVEHQIGFVLPARPGEVIGIALNRERHDFTTEEAAMLELLRSPLSACYQRLVEREQLTSLLTTYESSQDIAGRASALGLSERQAEVIHAVVAGASNAEIAISLKISRRTVEKHLQHIYTQLDVTSRTQAIGKVQTDRQE